MPPKARIFVAGHRGLVGSALARALTERGYDDLITHTHAEVDLTDERAVRELFEREKPAYVFLAAAKVGGIVANDTYPAEFVRSNLAIQQHVIHESWRAGVKRLIFLGSSCIYPRDCPQPIREEYLLTGPLEATNRAYAVAKIAGIEMCRSYNVQYSTRFLAVMPTNLYGPGDNYDPENSHVLPALIRKIHVAKTERLPEVIIWGSGSPRREFLYSDDLASACVFLLELADETFDSLLSGDGAGPLINVGCGEDQSILELAALVGEVIGYTGRFTLDPTRPDGTPRKLLAIDRMTSLGWRPRIGLREGIARAYDDYLRRLS